MCLHVHSVGATIVVDILGTAKPEMIDIPRDKPVILTMLYTTQLLVGDQIELYNVDVEFLWPDTVSRITARRLPEHEAGVSMRVSVWQDAWIINDGIEPDWLV